MHDVRTLVVEQENLLTYATARITEYSIGLGFQVAHLHR